MYNVDQWKVLKVLASALPKREAFRIKDVKERAFKAAPNDRVVRNAVRKPRTAGHVEIGTRGDYRLTQKGVSFFQKAEKEGFKPTSVRARPVRDVTKTDKKVEKKEVKKAAPAGKTNGKTNGKTAKKEAKKNIEKVASQPTPKVVEAKTEAKKSLVKVPRPKKAEPVEKQETPPPAQLTF